MPTRVEIHIVGLALCFFKNEVWNVVFVCDNVHPLEFTYPRGTGTASSSLREANRDLDINFSADEFTRIDEPFGDNFWRLFNMAAPYAHGSGKLRIERRRNLTDLVWMRVPAATFDVIRTTDNNYFVQEQRYAGAPVEIIGQVGKEAVLVFEMRERLAMNITDPDDGAYSRRYEFENGSGVIRLSFDNDCYANCTHNDFLDLYELVIDGSAGSERKFAAGQVKSTLINARRDESNSQTGFSIMSPQYGNCDPVGIEPPPGD